MHRFANPGRFLRLAERVLPWCVGVSAVSIAVGLYLALFVAPADYQQSESVRIMYVHVPSAWMALFVYTDIAVATPVPVTAGRARYGFLIPNDATLVGAEFFNQGFIPAPLANRLGVVATQGGRGRIAQ